MNARLIIDRSEALPCPSLHCADVTGPGKPPAGLRRELLFAPPVLDVPLAPDLSNAISGWIRTEGTATENPDRARLAIPELDIDTDVALNEKGFGEFRVAARPEYWSPEGSKLYEVSLGYGDHEVSDRIGFRRIETPNTKARLKFLERIVNRARSLDPSRLITAATDRQLSENQIRRLDDPLAGILDLIGVNSYCGWYSDKPQDCAALRWRSDYGKPVIVSEFGVGALQGRHGSAGERWTEECQANVYKNNLVMLENMPVVRGAAAWILKDFRSPRRPLPGIQDCWHRKGLLSEKGVPKQAWYVPRDFYAAKAATGDAD